MSLSLFTRSDVLRAVGGTFLNQLLLRSYRGFTEQEKDLSFHVVCAHPDDELALYPILQRAHNRGHKSGNDISYSLITNGTQGYDPEKSLVSRNQFGKIREEEFRSSIAHLGSTQIVNSLLDERELYEAVINRDIFALHSRFESTICELTKRFEAQQPDYIFSNDISGGHMIHDFTTNMVIEAKKRARISAPIVEYWQVFMRKEIEDESQIPVIYGKDEVHLWRGKASQIIGSLGDDAQGRVETMNIPEIGIKNGYAFWSFTEFVHTFLFKGKNYRTQKDSLERLEDISIHTGGLDAPGYRAINIETFDPFKRPSHGVLYEKTGWRLRGLERLPTFADYCFALECGMGIQRK